MNLTISHPTSKLRGIVELPLSKSESNRILILQALSNGMIAYNELSDARDTKILQRALASHEVEINVEDAGTAMRFLTAYYCATGQHKVLAGSERMCERPIGILVDALREIGFDIKYLKNEGFPPLEIHQVDMAKLKSEVSIAGNVSSQYISALMMIAPILENGLEIKFTTSLSSKPYILLTSEILKSVGIDSIISEKGIEIRHQSFSEKEYKVGADWSAASYWFSLTALSADSEISLSKLDLNSYQGDKIIADWCEPFGVKADQKPEGMLLHSNNLGNPINPPNLSLHFDFTDHPDLAQTMIVLCAAKNIKATFTGLKSLRIKETDRIVALQNELLKFGVKLDETGDEVFTLSGTFKMSHQTISTYNDHRMAMAFAPLALLGPITIEDSEVVQKSYPSFWKEMEKVGFIFSNTPR